MTTRINLLPREASKETRVNIVPVVLVSLLSAALMLFSAFITLQYQETKVMERKVAEARAVLDGINRDVELLKKVEQKIALMDAKLKQREEIEAGALRPRGLLQELKDIIPADVWLVDMGVAKGNVLALRGTTFSLESVARFVLNLQQSERFSSVGVSSVERTLIGEREVLEFQIQCEVATGR